MNWCELALVVMRATFTIKPIDEMQNTRAVEFLIRDLGHNGLA